MQFWRWTRYCTHNWWPVLLVSFYDLLNMYFHGARNRLQERQMALPYASTAEGEICVCVGFASSGPALYFYLKTRCWASSILLNLLNFQRSRTSTVFDTVRDEVDPHITPIEDNRLPFPKWKKNCPWFLRSSSTLKGLKRKVERNKMMQLDKSVIEDYKIHFFYDGILCFQIVIIARKHLLH